MVIRILENIRLHMTGLKMLLKGNSLSFSNEHDMCMFCLKRNKGNIYSISLLTD